MQSNCDLNTTGISSNSVNGGSSEDSDILMNVLKNPKEFGERLNSGELHRSQQESYLKKLNEAVKRALVLLTSSQDKENVDLEDTTQKDVTETIYSLTSILIKSVKSKETPFCEDLYHIISSLCGCLNDIECEKVNNAIVQLCEIWWLQNLKEKNVIIRDAFFYLLQKCLIKKTKSDVKRALKLVSFLQTVQLKENEIAIVIQCATSNFLLSFSEGRRFISLLIQLTAILPELHTAIKIKLTEYNDTRTVAYGEIYYNAWRLTDVEEIRSEIEEKCIQDLMFHCIHASKERLARSLRKLLGHFHSQYKQKPVGNMLFRLYQPILWRSLKVANSFVRVNATALLFSVFPLTDPFANRVECDQQLERQLSDAESLLMDPFPTVRVVAIEGICRVCKEMWDTLDGTRVKNLLKLLAETLAFDSSSVAVRVAVFNGFTILLDNVMSHSVLIVHLRSLGDCLFDKSENICLAFLDMLMALKGRRTIRFWDIASSDKLFIRLQDASPNVAKRIVVLLMDTYHPLNGGNSHLLHRSLMLIEECPTVFQSFYLELARLLKLEDVVHFLLVIYSFLKTYSDRIIAKAIEYGEMFEDPNESEEKLVDDEPVLEDITSLQCSTIKCLIEVVCIMWMTRKRDLENKVNVRLLTTLRRSYTVSMTKFFKVFRDTEAFQSLIYLSGFIPASKVLTSVSYCLAKVKSFSIESSEEDYGTILESLCNWGRGEELIELIKTGLQSGLELNTNEIPSKKSRMGKVVQFQVPIEPQPEVALELLSYLLISPVCRYSLLKRNRMDLIELLNVLRTAQKLLELTVYDMLPQDHSISQEYLLRIFFVTLELSMHLRDEKMDPSVDPVSYLSKLLVWTEEKILPKLSVNYEMTLSNLSHNRSSREVNSDTLCLPWEITLSVLKQLSVALLANVCDMELPARIANFLGAILSSRVLNLNEEADQVISYILRVIWRLEEFCLTNNGGEGVVCLSAIPSLLKSFVNALALYSTKYQDKLLKLTESLRTPMSELLNNSQQYAFLKNSLQDVVNVIVDISVADVAKSSVELLELSAPPLTSFLWLQIIRHPFLTRKYLEKLKIFTQSLAVDNIESIAAVICIINLFTKKGNSQALLLKEIILILEEYLRESHLLPKDRHQMNLEDLKLSIDRLKISFGIAS